MLTRERVRVLRAELQRATSTIGRLRRALAAACGALEDEVAADGDGPGAHPVIREHARIARRSRKVLRETEERR